MTHFFFKWNKAALFREWRISRTWLLGLGLLSLIGPLSTFIASIQHVSQENGALWVYWHGLIPTLYGYHVSSSGGLPPASVFHAYSDPTISAAWALFAGILGVIPWATERLSSARYTALLMVPIKRTEIVRWKLVFGFTVVFGIQIIRGAIAIGLNRWSGTSVTWHVLAGWWITSTLCMLVALTTGLLIASVVTFWLPSAVLTYVGLYLPFAIASFLDRVVNYSPTPPLNGANLTSQAAFSAQADPFGWLKTLSPLKFNATSIMTNGSNANLNFVGFDSGEHYMYMAAGVWIFFGIWMIAAILLTMRSFNHVPPENLSHFLVYPKLWDPLIIGASLFIGYLITCLTRWSYSQGVMLFIATLASAIIVYMIFQLLIRGYLRWSN